MLPTTRRAVGRWHEILPCLGIEPKFLKRRQGPCPCCGGTDRFRYDDKAGRGTYYCNHCLAGDGFKLLQLFHGWTFRTASTEVDKIIGNQPPIDYQAPPKPSAEAVAERMAQQWLTAHELKPNDPVLAYLATRAIAPKLWRNIRHCSATNTMLALYRTADGRPGTLHTTPLQGGRKLFFKDAGIEAGGAVRLMKMGPALAVAEGIETALSGHQIFKVPAWACLTADLLAKWEPPAGVEKVIVLGDHDANFTGQAAAYTLARRLFGRVEVTIRIPEKQGYDWNDVLKGSHVAPPRGNGTGEAPRSQQTGTHTGGADA